MMVDKTSPHSRSSLRRVQLAKKRWEEHKILLERNDEKVNDTVSGSVIPPKDSSSEDTAPEQSNKPVERTRNRTAKPATGPREKTAPPAGLKLTPSPATGSAKTTILFGLPKDEGKNGFEDGPSSSGLSNEGNNFRVETSSAVGIPSVPVPAPAPFTFSATAKTGSGGGFSFGATAPVVVASKDEKMGSATTPQGSAAFPPLATKAPVSFGGAESAEMPKGTTFSSVTPFNSMVQANPVSGGVKPKDKTVAGASAFPPMSTKAPTPFSQGEPPSTKEENSSSAAFPPMSLAAPSNPFSKKPEAAVGSANPAVERRNVVVRSKPKPQEQQQLPTSNPFANLNLSSSSSSTAKPVFSFGGQEFATASSLSVGDSSGAQGFSFSFGGPKSAGGGLASSAVAVPSTEAKGAISSANTDQTPFHSFVGTGAETSVAANVDPPNSSFLKPAQSTSANASADTVDYKAKLTEFYKEHNPDKIAMVDSNLAKYLGKEDELFRKLYSKYGLTQDGESRSPYPEPEGSGPRCFLELSVGGQPVGRVNIQLFSDKTPITANNFLGLCTGSWIDEGGNQQGCKTFVNNCFHRIVPGMCLQGGDITLGNGRGGRSIYPANSPTFGTDAWGKFKDETPFMSHSKRGLLSMANAGANQNGSQFFITLKELPYLNGKHVVFGKVLNSDMKVLDRVLDLVEVDPKRNHVPKSHCKVVIEACGQI